MIFHHALPLVLLKNHVFLFFQSIVSHSPSIGFIAGFVSESSRTPVILRLLSTRFQLLLNSLPPSVSLQRSWYGLKLTMFGVQMPIHVSEQVYSVHELRTLAVGVYYIQKVCVRGSNSVIWLASQSTPSVDSHACLSDGPEVVASGLSGVDVAERLFPILYAWRENLPSSV